MPSKNTGAYSAAWAIINKKIHDNDSENAINDEAEKLYQKLLDNDMKQYNAYEDDCLELMNVVANVILQNTICKNSSHFSDVDRLIQNFAYNTLSDSNTFKGFFYNFCIAKNNGRGNGKFTGYFLGGNARFRKNYFIIDEDNDSVIKSRNQENASFWYTIRDIGLLHFGKYDPKDLNQDELEVVLNTIRYTVKDMKTYTMDELISFIHGRIHDPYVVNGDDQLTPEEKIGNTKDDPGANDISYIFQVIESLVKESDVNFNQNERDRAFIKILCDYQEEYPLLIHHAMWMSSEEMEKLIRYINNHIKMYGSKLTVKVLAPYYNLNEKTADSLCSQAIKKLASIMSDHPDIPKYKRKKTNT